MKLLHTLSALSLVAMFAAAPAAMAANATVGGTVGATTSAATGGTNAGVAASTDGTTVNGNMAASGAVSGDNGVSALGVNISGAGDTSTSVQSFTSNLTTEQQANIATGCKTTMAHPDKASADVLAFCKNSTITTSSAVNTTPTISGNPKSKFKAIAEPITSAKSQAAIAISQSTHSPKLTGREK